MYRIKGRMKSKANSTLPVDTSGWDVLNASWPNDCDAQGFTFEVTFKLPKVNTTVIDIDDVSEEFGRVVCGTRPCATCWACPCGARQHLATWAARKEGELQEEQGRVTEAMCLLGDQQQTIDEHWHISCKGVIANLTKMRKEKSKLEIESDEQKSEIASLKRKLSDTEQKLLVAREEEEIVSKIKAENEKLKEDLSESKSINLG